MPLYCKTVGSHTEERDLGWGDQVAAMFQNRSVKNTKKVVFTDLECRVDRNSANTAKNIVATLLDFLRQSNVTIDDKFFSDDLTLLDEYVLRRTTSSEYFQYNTEENEGGVKGVSSNIDNDGVMHYTIQCNSGHYGNVSVRYSNGMRSICAAGYHKTSNCEFTDVDDAINYTCR